MIRGRSDKVRSAESRGAVLSMMPQAEGRTKLSGSGRVSGSRGKIRVMPTSAAAASAAFVPVTNTGKDRSEASARPVAAWLFICCALVFAMIVVGGVTRLTHSGLSIVEWQPIVGTLPPLNDAEWQGVFAKYQQTPEFKQVNHAMTLAEFKGIYWWEYAHRLHGPRDRRRLPSAADRVRSAATHCKRTWMEARNHFRVGRAARRDGLVHGARAVSSTTRAFRSFG